MLGACPYCFARKGGEIVPGHPDKLQCNHCYLTMPIELGQDMLVEIPDTRVTRTPREVALGKAIDDWLSVVALLDKTPRTEKGSVLEVLAYRNACHAYLNTIVGEV